MPISVTCQCGARLEIDEKFLGKEVPCPDCQRPLPTKASAAPPPLEMPDFRRTSGLAVLSLTLAMVGAFTIVGTLAAIVVGVFALKEIANKSGKLEGLGFARAGIAVGAVFTFITLAAFVSPYVFDIDVILRNLAFAGRLKNPEGETIRVDVTNGDIEIQRPKPSEQWRQLLAKLQQTTDFDPDLLILVNVWEDAYISCQSSEPDGGEDDEALEKRAIERFRKSELVNLLSKRKSDLLPAHTVVEKKAKAADGTQEIIIDMRVGGQERRFLLIYSASKAQVRMNMVVGCARKGRFDRMQEEFRRVYASLKVRI